MSLLNLLSSTIETDAPLTSIHIGEFSNFDGTSIRRKYDIVSQIPSLRIVQLVRLSSSRLLIRIGLLLGIVQTLGFSSIYDETSC